MDKYNFALKNPGREQFDVLVMSAPTVDISNLDTSRLKTKDKILNSSDNKQYCPTRTW